MLDVDTPMSGKVDKVGREEWKGRAGGTASINIGVQLAVQRRPVYGGRNSSRKVAAIVRRLSAKKRTDVANAN